MKFYSKKIIKLLKKNTQLSPSTWHKIMNPFCTQCLKAKAKNA